MNSFCPLPLPERITQHGASKHDQWPGYMTVLIVNHGVIKSICILTAVIHSMTEFDSDKLWDRFRQEVKWTLRIHEQLSTLCALYLDGVQHLPHVLLKEKDTHFQLKGINQFLMFYV